MPGTQAYLGTSTDIHQRYQTSYTGAYSGGGGFGAQPPGVTKGAPKKKGKRKKREKRKKKKGKKGTKRENIGKST